MLIGYVFEGRSQREVGEALSMSQMQVSRLLRSAIRRLRSRMDVVDRPGPRRLRVVEPAVGAEG